jgi:hypothetical protein
MAVTGEVLDAIHGAQAQAPATPLAAERVSCAAWDAAVARFDGISPEQTHTFARLRWPSLRHEPLLFRHGGEVVGGALMMIQRLPLGLGSVAIAKWAPMLADERRPDAAALYRKMIETLIGEYAVSRRMMLSILPRAVAHGGRDELRYLLERGFVAGSNVPFPNRYLVDLQISEDEHRAGLGAKWRYHLSRSEKAGLRFEVVEARALPAFAALYDAMSERKKFPDYSAYATVPALFAMESKALRPQLFFVRHGGEIVSGAVIFKAGDTAIYLYGATNAKALPLRAGYFMHWHIVRWLKAHSRARWYDLGGNDGFSGLHRFKKGLVGKTGVIVSLPPMLHVAPGRLSLALGTGAFALRDGLLNLRYRMSMRRGDRAQPDMTPQMPR